MPQQFKTSFGSTIEFIPGFKDAHLKVRYSDIVTPYADMVPDKGNMCIDGFVKDAYEYALMIDFLEELGVRTRWKKGLDLGGAEGTISRMLRGEGRLKQAVTIDMSDASSSLTTGIYARHWLRFKIACWVSRFSPALRRFLLGAGKWRGKRMSAMFNHWGYWPPASSAFWNLKWKAVPRLDRYIAGDVYEHNDKYDLVTAFFCLDYFDIEKAFRKISDLLVDDGTFFMAVNYWWYPVNASGIVGDFPYCCQRLTREDFQRYFQQHHPEEAADALQRYDYFHQAKLRPTLNDFAEIAARNGLTLLGTKRL